MLYCSVCTSTVHRTLILEYVYRYKWCDPIVKNYFVDATTRLRCNRLYLNQLKQIFNSLKNYIIRTVIVVVSNFLLSILRQRMLYNQRLQIQLLKNNIIIKYIIMNNNIIRVCRWIAYFLHIYICYNIFYIISCLNCGNLFQTFRLPADLTEMRFGRSADRE